MKHYLIAFMLCFGLIFLSCTETDDSFVDQAIAADSLNPGIDTIIYADTIYLPADSVSSPQDSIYFPVDSVTSPGDTILLRKSFIMNK